MCSPCFSRIEEQRGRSCCYLLISQYIFSFSFSFHIFAHWESQQHAPWTPLSIFSFYSYTETDAPALKNIYFCLAKKKGGKCTQECRKTWDNIISASNFRQCMQLLADLAGRDMKLSSKMKFNFEYYIKNSVHSLKVGFRIVLHQVVSRETYLWSKMKLFFFSNS